MYAGGSSSSRPVESLVAVTAAESEVFGEVSGGGAWGVTRRGGIGGGETGNETVGPVEFGVMAGDRNGLCEDT